MAMDGEKCSNSKWRHIKKPFRAKVIQTRKEFKFLNVPTQKKCAILACWKEFYLQKSFIILWCLPKRCFGLPEDRSSNCKRGLNCFLRRYAPIVKTTKKRERRKQIEFLDVLRYDVVDSSTVSSTPCFASSPLSYRSIKLCPLAGGVFLTYWWWSFYSWHIMDFSKLILKLIKRRFKMITMQLRRKPYQKVRQNPFCR